MNEIEENSNKEVVRIRPFFLINGVVHEKSYIATLMLKDEYSGVASSHVLKLLPRPIAEMDGLVRPDGPYRTDEYWKPMFQRSLARALEKATKKYIDETKDKGIKQLFHMADDQERIDKAMKYEYGITPEGNLITEYGDVYTKDEIDIYKAILWFYSDYLYVNNIDRAQTFRGIRLLRQLNSVRQKIIKLIWSLDDREFDPVEKAISIMAISNLLFSNDIVNKDEDDGLVDDEPAGFYFMLWEWQRASLVMSNRKFEVSHVLELESMGCLQ